MEITNEQKQVMLSGVLGDGCLTPTGAMNFNCSHKEYMILKKQLLGNMCKTEVREAINKGYKIAPIYSISMGTSEFGKKLLTYTHEDIVNELDELGIALWLFDDGSRHKKNNFYNINTHAIDRNIEEKVLIPFLNKWNIHPCIFTETKKDGRVFSYLYVSKWNGAMILSRMMRKLNLKCYDYKIMPVELEEAYFALKNNIEFISATSPYKKTEIVKKYLSLGHFDFLSKMVTSIEMKKIIS